MNILWPLYSPLDEAFFLQVTEASPKNVRGIYFNSRGHNAKLRIGHHLDIELLMSMFNHIFFNSQFSLLQLSNGSTQLSAYFRVKG